MRLLDGALRHFPRGNQQLLMNRMTQPSAARLDSRAKSDAEHSGGDEFEGLEQGGQANLWWSVLVTDDERGLAFGAIMLLQLKAVSDKANVALVGVKQVDGPILCLVPVVTEWASEFELERPPAWD
jgi:hypothetical protein